MITLSYFALILIFGYLMYILDSKHFAKLTLLLVLTYPIVGFIFEPIITSCVFLLPILIYTLFPIPKKGFFARRKFFNIKDRYFSIERSKKPCLPSHFYFKIELDEMDIVINVWSIYSWYFTIPLPYKWGEKMKKRISSSKFAHYAYNGNCWERELRFAIHHGSIWFNFWEDGSSWSSAHNRSFTLHVKDWIRGKHEVEYKVKRVIFEEVYFSPDEKVILIEQKIERKDTYKNLSYFKKAKWIPVSNVSAWKLKNQETSLEKIINFFDEHFINVAQPNIEQTETLIERFFDVDYVSTFKQKYGSDNGTHSTYYGQSYGKKHFDGINQFYMDIIEQRVNNGGYSWLKSSK